MAGCVDCAGEFIDREDARVGVADARFRFVEGDVTVDADSSVTDFDPAGLFDHAGECGDVLR